MSTRTSVTCPVDHGQLARVENPNGGSPLPGPRGLSWLGTATSFLAKGILPTFVDLADRYGPSYQLSLPFGHTAVMLSQPDGIERVLRGNRENYRKGSVYDGAQLLLGNGLVTSEGAFWARQRQLARPAFTEARLSQYLRVMVECTEQFLEVWRGQPGDTLVDIHEAMTHLTMAIVGRTLFGLDLSHQSSAAGMAFTHALRAIGTRGPGNLQIPLWLPTPGNRRFAKARRELDCMVYEIVRRFRNGEAENAEHTLLGAFMAARDAETGEGMSDQQLRDEVITLYLVGHETTANLLTWAFYALAREPDVVTRMEHEFDTLIARQVPTLEDLKPLTYTPRVLSEVLRLYPPVWTIARNVVDNDVVCGYRVPGGSFVMLSPYITHRLADHWPEPERFDPERFVPGISKGRHPFAYFPFSAGPRVCIGKHFSLYEAQLVLAMVMREFRAEVVDGQDVRLKAESTLRPDRKIWMRVRPR